MNLVEWQIADLKPYSRQAAIYGDLPALEYAALRDDIARRGIRQPILVTADGRIVDGHQRVRVCLELGITTIMAILCIDKSEDDIEETFLLQNLMGRQLDPIAKATAFMALIALERRRRGTDSTDDGGDLRDALAKRLGGNLSGRTIDRYLQLLRLPPVIRQAVSADVIPMAKALSIERLGLDVQEKIANRISSGDSVNQILSEYFPRRNRGEKKDQQSETSSDLYLMLFDFLAENLSLLNGEITEFVGQAGDHDRTVKVFDAAAKFCSRMSKLEKNAQRQSLRKIQTIINTARPDTVSGQPKR